MDEDKLEHLYAKGDELYDQYERGGNPAHIAEAITSFQDALELCSPGHSNRRVVLGSLALALDTRYDREGNVDDLSLAIAYYEEVLSLYPDGHPDRPRTLNNLGLALRTRYEHGGNMDDLALAIAHHQENLVLRPVGHPERPNTLASLAVALTARYNREGNVPDLSLAIEYHQEALAVSPDGHPYRSRALNNLGMTLATRYKRERNVDDLTLAIRYLEDYLALCPAEHPKRSLALTNLALALGMRYERERNDVDDPSRSITYHQEALSLFPVGHPNRANSLNNIALTLEIRYEREGNMDDLALAITYRHKVLDLQPPGHPLRSQSLRQLATSYWTSNNKQDGSAVDFFGEAATRVLDDGSSQAEIEDTVGSSFGHDVQPSSTSRIISLLREASQSRNCPPRDWLWAGLDWIEYSRVIDPNSTMEAYTLALRQLDLFLTLGQSLGNRQERLLSDSLLVRTRDLGSEAATWALQRGDPERAVEFVEQGRSLLLAQLGRYRAELNDLRRVDSELADRFEILSRRLDISLVSNTNIEEASSDAYEGYRRVSEEWNETVESIRTLPKFGPFLKPSPYEQLRKAAAEGPVIIIISNENGSDAIIVREHDPIHCVHLPLADSGRLLELSNNFLDAMDAEGYSTEKLCSANLRSLWKEVVRPIAQALQFDLGVPLGSRVWWCPTSVTSFLPLHAAGWYSKGTSGECFPNFYVSSYTPTFQALLRARREPKAGGPKRLLIVAQPATPGRSPLYCAMEEAAVVEKIVSPTRGVEVLSAEGGTREAVQLQMKSHSWMHFICHGIQVHSNPLNSYLALHDGPFKLHMLIEQNLPNADFAFISACHSAAGDKVLRNEALHLAAAMQFAGFRGVVGTLWEMADENGPPLAETFYREMVQAVDSRGAAKALSDAAKRLRIDGVPLNQWMRFIHIGL